MRAASKHSLFGRQRERYASASSTRTSRDEGVAIDLGPKFTVASMLRLAGPAIDATAAVTLGGASVDELGRWAPQMNEEVRLTGHEFIVDVPAASATLVSLRG